MKEILPVCLGLLAGGGLAFVRSPRLRAILLPILAVTLGALASWANGELESRWWAAFLSFDALLVWLGALTAFYLVDRRQRAREPVG